MTGFVGSQDLLSTMAKYEGSKSSLEEMRLILQALFGKAGQNDLSQFWIKDKSPKNLFSGLKGNQQQLFEGFNFLEIFRNFKG